MIRRLRWLFVAAVVGILCGPLTVAFASWTATGSGAAAAKAVTVGPGNAPSVSVSGRTVSLTWSTSTFSDGTPLSGYLIKRYDAGGATPQTLAAGTCAVTVYTTSCNETSVPAGTWRYTVTPAVGNWRGAESTQVVANVGGPGLTLSPTTTTAPATLSGSISSFAPGTLSFRLDNASTGTVLAGSVGGAATPSAIPVAATATVTVTLPASAAPGSHTVWAVSTAGESAGAGVTVTSGFVPAPTISSGPSSPTSATSATFAFSSGAVASYRCTLDGSAPAGCSTGVVYNGLTSASHTFTVTAIDFAGTSSAATTYTWLVDAVAPTGSTSFPTSGGSFNAAGFTGGCSTPAVADICGSAADSGSGVATVGVSVQAGAGAFWDGTAWVAGPEKVLAPTGTTSWTLGLPTTQLTNGTTYTVRVHVSDVVGNVAAVASSTFVFDTVAPPVPTYGGAPGNPTTSTTAAFSVADSDPAATLSCSLDGAAPAPCGPSITYTGLTSASHTFVVSASDAAGNSSSAAPYTWLVDAVAPTGAVTSPANGSSYNTAGYNAPCSTPAGDICGTASDAGSGVGTVRITVQQGAGNYYSSATSAFSSATATGSAILVPTGTTAWTYPLAAATLANGSTYTVRLYVTDAVGNASPAITSVFTYDTSAPATPVLSTLPANPTAQSTASITIAEADPTATLSCKLDTGAVAACTSPAGLSGLATGSHTFSVFAVDPAGNTSATASYTWNVDTTAPSGAITFPVSGSYYGTTRYNAGCGGTASDVCGTAADIGQGISTVRISVQAGTGSYWNGTGFVSATEALLTPTGTANWSYALASGSLVDGVTYTVRVHVTDLVGNTSATVASSFVYDTTPPTGSAVTTGNAAGGTPGKAEAGDSLTYAFSEPMDPTTIFPGWNGASANVVVRLTNIGTFTDVVTVYDATNTTMLNLGIFNLGQAGYVTGNVTFGATGTPSTIVLSGSTVTVTLGTVSAAASVGTVAGTGTTQWFASTTPTDRAGNAFTGTPPTLVARAF